jgi:integrase
MARRTAGLTARKVETVKTPGMYADGGGLYLQVAPTGAKTWIYRFQLRGRRRDMGLGSTAVYPLAEARRKASDARRLVAEGIDPIEQRGEKAAAAAASAVKMMAFEECAERYMAAHRSGWRNEKHKAQWASTLATYVYPVLGRVPVAAVDIGLVTTVIEPIWSTKPETASRVRGRIEAVLNYATAQGWRQGANPARWRGHLDQLLPKKTKVRRVKHHAALPYAELPAFMPELRQQQGVAARALELAILCAARTAEVIGARWEEFDLAGRLWAIPAERMKAGKEHRVPLPGPAIGVLEQMTAIRQSEFVFAGEQSGRPISNMAMLMLLCRMGRGDLTVHGFRSSFRDWVAERTTFPTEVAEMALAHTVSDKVEAAYRRGDLFEKRRHLAEAWAKYCTRTPIPAGQVIGDSAIKSRRVFAGTTAGLSSPSRTRS